MALRQRKRACRVRYESVEFVVAGSRQTATNAKMSRDKVGLTDMTVLKMHEFCILILRLLGRLLFSVLFYRPFSVFQRSLQVEPGPPKGIPKKFGNYWCELFTGRIPSFHPQPTNSVKALEASATPPRLQEVVIMQCTSGYSNFVAAVA